MRIYYNVYKYMVSAMLSHRDTVTVCEDNTFIQYTQADTSISQCF